MNGKGFDMETDQVQLTEGNLYLDLELWLDPPIVEFDRLKWELQRGISECDKLYMIDPKFHHKKQIIEAFCQRTHQPEPPEPTLVEMAREARKLREAEGRKLAEVIRDISITIEQVDYDDLCRKFRQFSEETIKSWFHLHQPHFFTI